MSCLPLSVPVCSSNWSTAGGKEADLEYRHAGKYNVRLGESRHLVSYKARRQDLGHEMDGD